MFAYCLQMQNNHIVSVCSQARASRRPTCEPPSCRSFWRRCSVCCSQCAPPRRTCRSSTSPSSCRWSTAPSSTAGTRPSSAWRECWILLGFSGPLSSRQMNAKWQYRKNKQAFFDFILLGSHHFLLSSSSFPSCHFGKLYGMILALSAVFAVLQYPCFALVKGALNGDPLYVS